MDYNNHTGNRDSTRIILSPPTFSPPPEMRAAYLGRRKEEMDTLLDHARAGEWNPVMTVANHVRGTGAMYGFADIGRAAAELVRAVQHGDANSLEFMRKYAQNVTEAYV
jgi:hypothetical protein